MASYKVILLPEALSDLQAIHAHIAQDSPDNAAAMAERIDAIDGLAEMPRRFAPIRTRRKLAYEVRAVIVRPYKVLYSVEGQAVYIRTIRHGARRPWP